MVVDPNQDSVGSTRVKEEENLRQAPHGQVLRGQ